GTGLDLGGGLGRGPGVPADVVAHHHLPAGRAPAGEAALGPVAAARVGRGGPGGVLPDDVPAVEEGDDRALGAGELDHRVEDALDELVGLEHRGGDGEL